MLVFCIINESTVSCSIERFHYLTADIVFLNKQTADERYEFAVFPLEWVGSTAIDLHCFVFC